MTGKIIYKISTGPARRLRRAAWQDHAWSTTPSLNNTTRAVYGGDLLGNVWRFDVNAAPTATRLATAKDLSDNPQPITVRPELAESAASEAAYPSATGKYLGAGRPEHPPRRRRSRRSEDSSVTDSAPRTCACTLEVRHPIDRTRYGPAHPDTVPSPTDWSTNGWLVDLPDTGERVNVDLWCSSGTLSVAVERTDERTCNRGRLRWFNFFDVATGGSAGAGQ